MSTKTQTYTGDGPSDDELNHGKASSGTTTLDIDLTVTGAQHWTDAACSAD